MYLEVTPGPKFGFTVHNKINQPIGLYLGVNGNLNLVNNLIKPKSIWVKFVKVQTKGLHIYL